MELVSYPVILKATPSNVSYEKGAISQRLAPYCKRIVGIDINSKAVDLYNEKVSHQGIPPEGITKIPPVHKSVKTKFLSQRNGRVVYRPLSNAGHFE